MVLNIKQNKEIRDKNYIRIINRKIQPYIKNPIGGLDLIGLPIYKLPSNLKYINDSLNISYTKIYELPDDIIIEGSLYCWGTPLGRKYSKQELKKKFIIKGEIYGTEYN